MTSKRKSRKKKVLFICLVIGTALLVLAALFATGALGTKKPDKATATASQATKGEPATSTNSGTQQATSNSAGSSTQPGDEKSSSGGTNSASLLTPTGDFVSNHHPGQNGSPLSESSVCTTTPGATCVISFTKDGATKSLGSQVVDRGGSAYWNWSVHDLGLTTGSWQITATASLNGQTKSAADATDLVVSQ